MNKINELLTSGQINGIEYYNYFKNRNDFSLKQEDILYSNNLKRNYVVQQQQQQLLHSCNGSNNSRNTGNKQQLQQKSNKQKFNAYLMNNNASNSNTHDNNTSPPPPPQQQQQKQQSPILSASQSFTNLKQQFVASSNFDKKKEDAINRIIRNERIKEIRTKIYEYELLKEYQKYNENNNKNCEFFYTLNNTNDDCDSTSVDSYCTDYGFESIENEDDLFYDNQIIPTTAAGKNRKSLSPTSTNLLLKKSISYSCDYLTDNATDDSTTAPMNAVEDNSSSCSSRQTRRTKNIKPGYELYQIGNLNTPQSAFQLKCSIISAELKNIVNVLKQVR